MSGFFENPWYWIDPRKSDIAEKSHCLKREMSDIIQIISCFIMKLKVVALWRIEFPLTITFPISQKFRVLLPKLNQCSKMLTYFALPVQNKNGGGVHSSGWCCQLHDCPFPCLMSPSSFLVCQWSTSTYILGSIITKYEKATYNKKYMFWQLTTKSILKRYVVKHFHLQAPLWKSINSVKSVELNKKNMVTLIACCIVYI